MKLNKWTRAALAFRAVHAAIAVEMLLAIGYVWCALAGRRGRLLRIAVATSLSEGGKLRCLMAVPGAMSATPGLIIYSQRRALLGLNTGSCDHTPSTF